MADNIDNSGTLTFNNMKPDNDEEITALWGQNMGDNIGYLYHTTKSVFDIQYNSNNNLVDWLRPLNLSYFKKYPGMDSISGTLFMSQLLDGTSGPSTASLRIDGTANAVTVTVDSALDVISDSTFGSTAFTYDISSFPDFSDISIELRTGSANNLTPYHVNAKAYGWNG